MHAKAPAITRIALALTLTLGSAITVATAATAQTPVRRATLNGGAVQGVAADERAIRALSQQYLAAQRRGDAEASARLFAEDAVTIYNGREVRGRDAIRADIAATFKGAPDYTPSWETQAVTVAQSGDLAFETGVYENAWNGGRDRERGSFMTAWRKVGSEWRIARDMAFPSAPDKPGAVAASAAGGVGAGADPGEVRRAIEAASAKVSEALRRNDTAAVMSVYADDAIVLWNGQKAWHGKAEFLREVPKALGDVAITDNQQRIDDILVSGDLAVETGTYLNTLRTKTGQTLTAGGKNLVVWKRQPDGSWKIAREMGNDGPPAAKP